jgi:hypothetical protein
MGWKKEGHPVPELYFALASKSGTPLTAETHTPSSCVFCRGVVWCVWEEEEEAEEAQEECAADCYIVEDKGGVCGGDEDMRRPCSD